MARRTITEVYNRQVQHEQDDKRDFKSINDRLDNITPKVEEMHEYIIGQKAVNDIRSSGSWLSPDVVKIIIIALIVAALALGGKDLLKGFL